VILAIDPALATCGWAVVTPLSRVQALGVITTKLDDSVSRSTDRARRIRRISSELLDVAIDHNVSVIAAESLSFPRGSDGIAAIALCWGAIAMLAASMSATLLELEPKVWQRAVLPDSGKKVDYDRLEAALERFVPSSAGLDRVKPSLRNHALDAMAIGVYAAAYRGRGEIVIADGKPDAKLEVGHG
jgi:Holliday junction resolvasome RuvABC endonuclease subunit